MLLAINLNRGMMIMMYVLTTKHVEISEKTEII